MGLRLMVGVALIAALGGAAGIASSASAASASGTGTATTGGGNLNVRIDPSTNHARVATIADGTRFRIVCQELGQRISGTVRVTSLWDRIATNRYVSDAYVSRSGAALPRCASTSGSPAPTASGWTAPVPGQVVSGYRTKDRPTHEGVDLGAARYTRIKAASAGTVVTSECNISRGHSCDVDGGMKVGGCGWYVEIQHVGGILTRYCHMVRRPAVKVGDTVRVGQVIGQVGMSGNASGPHLHFEVRRWQATTERYDAINPVPFLRTKGVHLG